MDQNIQKISKKDHYKGINHIIGTIGLIIIGILIVVYLFQLIMLIKNPPPYVSDLSELLAIIMPLMSVVLISIVTALGISCHNSKKDKQLNELITHVLKK